MYLLLLVCGKAMGRLAVSAHELHHVLLHALCRQAGLPAAEKERGWDHGVFVPLKLMYPDADIPIVAISTVSGLDPQVRRVRVLRSALPSISRTRSSSCVSDLQCRQR